MTIILAIIAQAEILAMDGKHNFVALYANIMVVAIVKIAIRWIFKPAITVINKTGGTPLAKVIVPPQHLRSIIVWMI